ncbi:MAG TPA: chemotaxis protein CheX [Treponemataceae bacterium]|jgi:chemotaxis protein CheX|nr:chemotaxis protein CheX [Treponemataceae bacterium]HOS34655.1 chemotaxis protein CheX [Treponemataceae bacterium]HOU37306.1 chemotaxis protein CheX [Treponemataceae bacterium]HPL90823.1 chemotaxis protein CheX [Treponemataceae bacterium]HPX12801.1 chemotaxis protein CheX [Treponemataceae bacterium]
MEKYIQPFVDVCVNVFKEFIGVELETERPHFADKNDLHSWDVSAVIGLTGEARGAVVISMKADLACRLTGMLTGSEHSGMDDEVIDAIGEIINIIAGNAKRGLEESFRLVISLPTIIRGSNHAIQWPNDQARIICIPFKIFDDETFFLSVAIEASHGA